MNHYNRILIVCVTIFLASTSGFSQDTTVKEKSETDEAEEESSRTNSLRKLENRSQLHDLNIHIDETIEGTVELAIENAMRAVDAVKRMEIDIRPIDIDLSDLNIDIDPIDIHIPDIDVDIEPIDVDLDDLDIDIDVDDFNWNRNDDDDAFDSMTDENEDKDKEKEKMKAKDKEDKNDKSKGLKKIN